MLSRGFHHASLPVRDLARARAFYEGVLGFEVAEHRPDLPFEGVWYRFGNAELHLIVPPEGVDTGAPPPVLNPLAVHSAFAVEDYAGTVAHFRRHGVDVLETHPEIGQLWVRDPDGNILEFIVDRGGN